MSVSSSYSFRCPGSRQRCTQADRHLGKVSGGGGWGLKQGLLSLDPQTRFDSDEDRDVDDFIRAFGEMEGLQGHASSSSQSSAIVSPGSQVQFFTSVATGFEPGQRLATLAQSAMAFPPPNSTAVFGTMAPEESEDMPASASTDAPIELKLVQGHFGAVSAAGMFVESGETHEGEKHQGRLGYCSKIDAPHSFTWHE